MTLVAIVGRPNVGKSSLFNRICGRRRALVDDLPGVTRDRNYAQVHWSGRSFSVVDTGGFVTEQATSLEDRMREQIELALREADLVLVLADAKTGLHPEDEMLVGLLRRTAKPVIMAVNKVDGAEEKTHLVEFYRLGLDPLFPISAAHGFGVGELLDHITASIGEELETMEAPNEDTVRLAIVGRPNVGKSTLVNAILKAPRVLVSEIPGTTRDAIDTFFDQHGQRYLLIDTAGIRRKGRTQQKLEKVSVIKALHSIDRSHVAVLVLDALEGLTDQDLHVAGYIHERFRGCVVVVNKWDGVEGDARRSKQLLDTVKERLRFMPYAPIVTLSALTGKRVSRVLPTVMEVFREYTRRIATAVVNQVLDQAVKHHEPPHVGRRALKFYYATQVESAPPTFVVFCNYPGSIHFSYQRYLINHFREALELHRVPIKLVFRRRRRAMEKQ